MVFSKHAFFNIIASNSASGLPCLFHHAVDDAVLAVCQADSKVCCPRLRFPGSTVVVIIRTVYVECRVVNFAVRENLMLFWHALSLTSQRLVGLC